MNMTNPMISRYHCQQASYASCQGRRRRTWTSWLRMSATPTLMTRRRRLSALGGQRGGLRRPPVRRASHPTRSSALEWTWAASSPPRREENAIEKPSAAARGLFPIYEYRSLGRHNGTEINNPCYSIHETDSRKSGDG